MAKRTVFHLLAEVVDDRFTPDGRTPTWTVVGQRAFLDWDSLSGYQLVASIDEPGKEVLVLWSPPPIVPLIEQLHSEGWRRGGWSDHGGWSLYAYKRDSDAEVRIVGSVSARNHPDRDTMNSFWGASPPVVSRRKSFKAEYEKWNRMNREDLW